MMTGVERIAKLHELDHERSQLVKRLVVLDQEMEGVIGAGFDIPGGRVIPTKRKRKADYGQSPLAPSAPPAKPGTLGQSQSHQKEALEYLEAHPAKLVGAELLMSELGAKGVSMTIDQARNTLYWLYKDGKCQRPERGKYQAIKKK